MAPSVFRVLPTRDLAGAVQSPILSQLCLLAQVELRGALRDLLVADAPGCDAGLTRALLTRLPVLGFFAALVIQQLLIPPDRPDPARRRPGSSTTCPRRIRRGSSSTAITGCRPASSRSRSPRRFLMLLATASLLAARRAAPPLAEVKPKEVVKVLDL